MKLSHTWKHPQQLVLFPTPAFDGACDFLRS